MLSARFALLSLHSYAAHYIGSVQAHAATAANAHVGFHWCALLNPTRDEFALGADKFDPDASSRLNKPDLVDREDQVTRTALSVVTHARECQSFRRKKPFCSATCGNSFAAANSPRFACTSPAWHGMAWRAQSLVKHSGRRSSCVANSGSTGARRV